MSIRDIIKVLLIIALIAAALAVFGRVENVQSREESVIVRDAVRQAAITCYAVEGAYPDSVEYLREHYQLAYDEDRYAVTLDAFASNLIPDIYIEDRYAPPTDPMAQSAGDDGWDEEDEVWDEEAVDDGEDIAGEEAEDPADEEASGEAVTGEEAEEPVSEEAAEEGGE